MKTARNSLTLALLLTAAGALYLQTAPTAWAAASARMSQAIYNDLQAAQELADNGNIDGAQAIVDRLLTKELGDYEKAQLLNVAGYVAFQAKRYDEALAKYEQMLQLEELPLDLLRFTLKIACQLSAATERYDASVGYGKRLLELGPQGDDAADVHLILAESLYKLERHAEALDQIGHARAELAVAGRAPRENLLQLHAAIHYELEDFEAMAEVLTELVNAYPRDNYIINLASVYGFLERTQQQLALLEPLYEIGRLTTEAQLLTLANLYMLHELPFKAAKLLERELDRGRIQPTRRNLEAAAQAWQLALDDERAVPLIQRAAELADDGNGYVMLAQSRMNLREWQPAEAALEAALAKGGLRNEGNAQLLLGMVRLYQRKHSAAITAFRRAERDRNLTNTARQWIAYARQDEERLAALRQNPG
jgi:tetratricopeptide (TPR) repeat protein